MHFWISAFSARGLCPGVKVHSVAGGVTDSAQSCSASCAVHFAVPNFFFAVRSADFGRCSCTVASCKVHVTVQKFYVHCRVWLVQLGWFLNPALARLAKLWFLPFLKISTINKDVLGQGYAPTCESFTLTQFEYFFNFYRLLNYQIWCLNLFLICSR